MLSLDNVDSFWDVAGIFLAIVLAPAVVAAIPLIIKQRQHNRDVASTLAAVRNNVQNGHDAPMREDIDRILSKLDAQGTKLDAQDVKLDGLESLVRSQGRDVGGIRQDVGHIHGEMRETKAEMRELETRAVMFARREHPGSPPL